MGDTHKVVSKDEWFAARVKLLAAEKEFKHARDHLSQQRRDLPWERVDKEYVFDGTKGKETLAQLFDNRSQLIVYHFMFDPEWEAGCKSCSWWADNFERNVVHLNHRDVSLVALSRAPLSKIEAFKRRIGWSFKWLSSAGCDFNYDYGVSFTPGERAKGDASYNYGTTKSFVGERPGISIFYKDAAGTVFHTYSCYGRGLDMLNVGYHYLDLVPKGLDEAGLPMTQAWVRHRDNYED
jgi:predicted dithiol-disulfide oxidoreductase (DUF899 family)